MFSSRQTTRAVNGEQNWPYSSTTDDPWPAAASWAAASWSAASARTAGSSQRSRSRRKTGLMTLRYAECSGGS